MFYTPMTEQFKQVARQDFEKLQQASVMGRAWSLLSGRENHLLRLEEEKRGKQVRTRSDVGIQTVAIESIRGSESRNRDFDRAWRPLQRNNQERWTSIAVARMTDVPLPAVDLIKAGDGYFVRDGHHRISVAKHHGQMEIEANVTEWCMTSERSPSAASNEKRTPPSRQIASMSMPFVQSLAAGASSLSKVVGTLQREVNYRVYRFFGRAQKPFNSGTAA